MARAWSRLARAVRDQDGAMHRVVHAMRTRPFLVGGTDRFDSVLIEETDGRVVAKIGAEGVHCVGVPELGVGFAVKVDDGAQRAQFPAVLRVLQLLDVLPGDAAAAPRGVLPPVHSQHARRSRRRDSARSPERPELAHAIVRRATRAIDDDIAARSSQVARARRRHTTARAALGRHHRRQRT